MTTDKVLMCPPTFFKIGYEINPWMKLSNPVVENLAQSQWQKLYDVYVEKLKLKVHLIDPQPGLPDMVFTANGALVIREKAMIPSFRHSDRQPETAHFKAWLKNHSISEIGQNKYNFEGEGDCLLWRDYLFLGYPWRSDQASRSELENFFKKKVVPLQLTDARFYHLDTCFTPIDQETIALYEPALSAESLRTLSQLVPKIIKAEENDALTYGLNAFVRDKDIVIPAGAENLIQTYKSLGFRVFPVEIGEFQKSGGGVKCLTLSLH